MNKYEIYDKLGPIFQSESTQFVNWSFIPDRISFQAYLELLLDTPEFFIVFWNSIKIVTMTILGQMAISIPAAWVLSMYRFRLRKIIISIYIILMMIPFMVIMIPQYEIMNRLNLLDSLWAIIVPGIFSTLPVFIVYTFFSKTPKNIVEAARIDGANELQIFYRIGIPLGYPGIISAILLSFIEFWNIIEQPLIFIKKPELTTLTLYLPNISIENIRINLVASVITLVPSVIIFIIGQSYLEEGISSIITKE